MINAGEKKQCLTKKMISPSYSIRRLLSARLPYAE